MSDAFQDLDDIYRRECRREGDGFLGDVSVLTPRLKIARTLSKKKTAGRDVIYVGISEREAARRWF